jgi:hypothetical protein
MTAAHGVWTPVPVCYLLGVPGCAVGLHIVASSAAKLCGQGG